jgi:hypothetical protein
MVPIRCPKHVAAEGRIAQIPVVPGATRMRQFDPLRTFSCAVQLEWDWAIGERLLWRGTVD